MGSREMVELMIRKGVDVNGWDGTYYKWSPLMYASLKGFKHLVELLINNGADVDDW